MVPPENRTALTKMFQTYGAAVTTELLPASHQLTPQDLAHTRTWLHALENP